jgi:urea transport system permease protein
MSLVGAVYGTLLVNAGKTFFSESFPDLWLFLMAALFIGVTMAFPMGLAGLWESHVVPWWTKRRGKGGGAAAAPGIDAAVKPARKEAIDPKVSSRLGDVSGQRAIQGSI